MCLEPCTLCLFSAPGLETSAGRAADGGLRILLELPIAQSCSCCRSWRTRVMELWDKNQGLFWLGNPLLKLDPCYFYLSFLLDDGTEGKYL